MDFKITASQMKKEIILCCNKGRVPYFVSSPGIGKSTIAYDVAQEANLFLIDMRLSQCTPEDLQGFPMRVGNKATFVPFDMFPIEGDTPPEGYDGWMLLLDELSSASKPVQAAAYKLILDRKVGSHKLNDKCVVVAAGNKRTDKAIVVDMSTALKTRLVHYELESNITEWTEWAYKNKIDHRIISYLNFMKTDLMNFNPNIDDKTFACPRTWHFLSDLIEDEPVITNVLGPRVTGTVGNGAGIQFITFCSEFDKLPSIDKIAKDPDSVDVPKEASTKYAALSMLTQNHTEENLENIIKYMSRFGIEMQIVFCRGINILSPTLRSKNKIFGDYIKKIMRNL